MCRARADSDEDGDSETVIGKAPPQKQRHSVHALQWNATKSGYNVETDMCISYISFEHFVIFFNVSVFVTESIFVPLFGARRIRQLYVCKPSLSCKNCTIMIKSVKGILNFFK